MTRGRKEKDAVGNDDDTGEGVGDSKDTTANMQNVSVPGTAQNSTDTGGWNQVLVMFSDLMAEISAYRAEISASNVKIDNLKAEISASNVKIDNFKNELKAEISATNVIIDNVKNDRKAEFSASKEHFKSIIESVKSELSTSLSNELTEKFEIFQTKHLHKFDCNFNNVDSKIQSVNTPLIDIALKVNTEQTQAITSLADNETIVMRQEMSENHSVYDTVDSTIDNDGKMLLNDCDVRSMGEEQVIHSSSVNDCPVTISLLPHKTSVFGLLVHRSVIINNHTTVRKMSVHDIKWKRELLGCKCNTLCVGTVCYNPSTKFIATDGMKQYYSAVIDGESSQNLTVLFLRELKYTSMRVHVSNKSSKFLFQKVLTDYTDEMYGINLNNCNFEHWRKKRKQRWGKISSWKQHRCKRKLYFLNCWKSTRKKNVSVLVHSRNENIKELYHVMSAISKYYSL